MGDVRDAARDARFTERGGADLDFGAGLDRGDIGFADIGWGHYYRRAVRVFEGVQDDEWRPSWP